MRTLHIILTIEILKKDKLYYNKFIKQKISNITIILLLKIITKY